MPRETDPFRKHVKFLPNKRWNCNFCGNLYAGSATRIKAHLAGVGGYGINDCKDVDGRVRSEALKALKGKTAVSNRPDNVEEGPNRPMIASNEDGRRETSLATMLYSSSDTISTVGANPSDFLPLHEMNVPSQSHLTQNMTTHDDFSFWTQPPQSHAGISNIEPWNLSYPSGSGGLASEPLTSMPRPVNAEEREPNPQDARTEDTIVISRPQNDGLVIGNVPSLKRKRGERSNRKVVDNCCNCSFRKLSTTLATRCRKSSPLLTTKLRGYNSEITIRNICDYLMEDEIVIIGIYGMGGVGKTAILKHVHNGVLENPTFNDVFWVSVPQKFSVYKLQDKIANVVGLYNISKYKDVERRACILDGHLKKKKRSILLLDGMWMHFEVKDVGIPIEKGGLKLVLTTRSLDVCHKMLCQKQIKINCLFLQDDCWNLFLETLCEKRITSEVEKIARSIVDKCGSLPLAIIEIAICMRGVEEVHEWKGMLRKLKESRVELNVFKTLKLSYMNLGDSQVQQCFLNLATSQGNRLNRTKSIESFIDNGLLDRIGTRQELHEEGNIILNKLRKVCLCDDAYQHIYLHSLIRDMALQILRTPDHMVKTYMGLKEIPEEKFWTDSLEKVFLQGNDIKEIPDGISPNCPKLTRLSLKDNMLMGAMHESFFTYLRGLKVLDLSKTKITKLPDTIFQLESLEALLLKGCGELCCIPCVRKLGSLRKLDLKKCAMLEEVPEGMEMLLKLSYLDLRGTKIKTLSEGVLGKLLNLQYLAIEKVAVEEEDREKEKEQEMAIEKVAVEEEDREEEKEQEKEKIKLTKVEGLYCSTPNVETFNAYVRFLEQNSSLPYELWLNKSRYHSYCCKHERHIIIKSCHSVAARVDGEIGGDGCTLLPKNVEVLEVEQCDGVRSLCEVGQLDNLEKLKIKKWEKLEWLGAIYFPCLRRLNIIGCFKLKHLLEEMRGLPHLQWLKIEGVEELEELNIAAPFLYSVKVYRCPKMKKVMGWWWLATRLPNLRSIKIKNCEQLEEIIGRPAMPSGAIYCLEKIKIEGCNNLKRVLMRHDMSVDLPFLRRLTVKDCKGIEVIIDIVPDMTQPSFSNLTILTLSNLPELKSIFDGTVRCLSLEFITITDCPKLKRLPLHYDGLPYHPYIGSTIVIDQLTWQSLERNHSHFQPSLEHLAWRYGDQRIVHRIESCDSIAARVDGEIGGDGYNLFLKNVQVLTVERGSGVTSLSEVGPLENLEELTIYQWEKLKELGAVRFLHLQKLDIIECSKLKHLSVEGQGLPHLQWFIVMGSNELEGIDLAAPDLRTMEVTRCPKMKRVVQWDWLKTHLPKLKSIKIRYCDKLEEIIGGPVPISATCFLTEIQITRCNNMKGVLLTHDMLLHIPLLRFIEVEDCKGIEEIIGTAPNMTQPSFPKLTRLTLWNLPKLKRICDRVESCDHIQLIEIYCPNLKRIPLRLRPLDNGLLSPPPSLGRIVTDEETWHALEWDHPLARVSLEPFINNPLPRRVPWL